MTTTKKSADRGYAICTSGRSGSNLLCQYLSSTGLLGHPLEYFNGVGRRMLGYPDFPDEPEKQIDWILTVGATSNGIYGLKVFPLQFDLVAKSIRWVEMLPNLNFVLLKRRNLLGQAISSLRAAQTNQWRSTMVAQGDAIYDGNELYRELQNAVRNYARWDIFFARNAIEPTVIVYEDLVGNPQSAIDQVAQLFGLRGQTPVAEQHINLEIQRDITTEQWRARFHEEYRNLKELDLP